MNLYTKSISKINLNLLKTLLLLETIQYAFQLLYKHTSCTRHYYSALDMELSPTDNFFYTGKYFLYSNVCFQFTINTNFDIERLQTAFLKSFHHFPRFTSKISPSPPTSTSTFKLDSSTYISPIFISDNSTFNKYQVASSYNIYIDLRSVNTNGHIFIRNLHAISALGDVVRLVRLASLFYNDPSYHTEIIPVKPTPSISGPYPGAYKINNWTLLKRSFLSYLGIYQCRYYTLVISKNSNSHIKQKLNCSTHDIVCALLTKAIQYDGFYISSNIDFKRLRGCPYVGNGLSQYFIPDTIDISTTSIMNLITTWTGAKQAAKFNLSKSPQPSHAIPPPSYIHPCFITNWTTLPLSNISFDNSSLRALYPFVQSVDVNKVKKIFPLLRNKYIIGCYNNSNSTSTFNILLDSSQYSRLLSLKNTIDFSLNPISLEDRFIINS